MGHVMLVGNDSAAELLYRVARQLRGKLAFACFVDEDMYFLGHGERIDADVVVLFISAASHDQCSEAYAHESALIARMQSCNTPCVIVYRNKHLPPPHLKSDEGLNVRRSFVPAATLGISESKPNFRPKVARMFDRTSDVAAVIAEGILRCASGHNAQSAAD